MTYAALVLWYFDTLPNPKSSQCDDRGWPVDSDYQAKLIQDLQFLGLDGILSGFEVLSGWFFPWLPDGFIDENYNTLRQNIKTGRPQPLILGGWNGFLGFWTHHEVLAYKLVETSTHRYIWIYENNNPEEELRITLTKSNNFWVMEDYIDNDKKHWKSIVALPMWQIGDFIGISYVLNSPGTLQVKDPEGSMLDSEQSEIDGGYYRVFDIDNDGHDEELAIILWPKQGEYTISVIPKPDAEPNETYTLEEYKFGKKTILAENVEIQNIPEQPYVSIAVILATVDAEPDILPVDCNGVHITSYIELPADYVPDQVDPNTIYVSFPDYPGYFAESMSCEIGDYDSDATPDLVVNFNSLQLTGLLHEINDGQTLELEVAGNLWDGTRFEGSDTAIVLFTVDDDTPPAISNLSADYPLAAVGQTITFSADILDDCDNHVDVEWDFGDSTAPSLNPTHEYQQPGIYTVTVTATDNFNNTSTDSIIIVVYDPGAGFTTGSGWFIPNSESFIDCVGVTDTKSKANFGFIVKYKKGADNPDGNLEFQYKAGDIDLKSTDMEWLVVQSDTKVRFKGKATINGEGSYTFKVTAEDNGEPGTGDWFKIEIWTGVVDTENGPPTPKHKAQGYLGGGNIQIHQK